MGSGVNVKVKKLKEGGVKGGSKYECVKVGKWVVM